MRLLADENFPGAAVDALKDAGRGIVWVRTAAPGMSDRDLLTWAAREGRVLLTFDKDFGELARTADLPVTYGVVLFRIVMPPGDIGQRLAAIIMSRDDWIGHFSVIEPGRVRMRPLS
jgi:predicted nuclease of predicted toxin-antitoxin system